ncbi:MAG TPA: hypothetical protein VFF11_12955 [Candidatus Binatia bacterium]|nr:hypothetical protein [Candidatus Binatia bacterium]
MREHHQFHEPVALACLVRVFSRTLERTSEFFNENPDSQEAEITAVFRFVPAARQLRQIINDLNMTLNFTRKCAILQLGIIVWWCGSMTASEPDTSIHADQSVAAAFEPKTADFDALRLRWRKSLVGGSDLNITDPDVQKRPQGSQA